MSALGLTLAPSRSTARRHARTGAMVHAGLRAASFRSTPREIHEVPSIQCRRPRLHRRLASRRRGRTERRRRLDRMVLQHRSRPSQHTPGRSRHPDPRAGFIALAASAFHERQAVLHRTELQGSHRRNRARRACPTFGLHQDAGRRGWPRRDDARAFRLGPLRLRKWAGRGDRQVRAARCRGGRTRLRRRLYLLQRRQHARLPEALGHGGQELRQQRRMWPVDSDHRRDVRSPRP